MKKLLLPIVACVMVFYAAALPLIVKNYDHGRAFDDQSQFHYPAIRHFAEGGGIDDYPSATTPGYHWILAAVARFISGNEVVLKIFSSLFTVAFLGALAAILSSPSRLVNRSAPKNRANSAGAVVFTTETRSPAAPGSISGGKNSHAAASPMFCFLLLLPVVCSIYIFPAGVWLLPDNLAWLTVLWVLALSLRPPGGVTWYVGGAAALLSVVLVRQSNFWTAAVFWTAAWTWASEAANRRQSRRAVAAALLATLPAVAALAFFAVRWKGLVPPTFAKHHESANPAAPAFFLAVVGFYSAFYLPCAAASLRRLAGDRKAVGVVAAGCLAGLALSLIAPTDWNKTAGRDSGLWLFAKAMPVVAHRSTLISILASLGGGCCAAWFLMAGRSTRWVFASAAVAFVASQTANHFVYERYYAGFAFMAILLLLRDILASETPRGRPSRWAIAGVLLFTAFNAAVLIRGLVR